MIGLSMLDVAAIFLLNGVCLFFIAMWIMKADSKRGVVKDEIARLTARAEACGRENIMLKEALENSASGPQAAPEKKDNKPLAPNAILLMQSMQRVEELERENEKLKSELAEATGSLEEIYKAVVEKNG